MAGCAHAQPQNADNVFAVTIKGTLTGDAKPGEPLYLLENFADEAVVMGKTEVVATGSAKTFTLHAPVPGAGQYFLAYGSQGRNLLPLLLDANTGVLELKLNASQLADGPAFGTAQVNEQFFNLNRRLTELNQVAANAQRVYADKPAFIQLVLDSVMRDQSEVVNAYLPSKGPLGTVARLLYFAPYGSGDEQKKYKDPTTYFTAEFLNQLPLQDGGLGYYPQFYGKVTYYVTMLAQQMQLPHTEVIKAVDVALARTAEGSRTRLMLLLGAAAALQPVSAEGFLYYARQLQQAYPQYPRKAAVDQLIAATEAELTSEVAIGKPAPDIVLKDINGQDKKLSALRGKYVLIDFWASWCRPCRLENPNVVRTYGLYKSKGFEILGVSIDQDAAAWKRAIQTDGLTWPQVIDTDGWQSAAIKTYRVSGIPHSVLLDPRGVIIAKNLRGPQLEARLAQIFQ
jgi:peroxiredoxin